jgi:hypothetical protein
LTINWSNWFRDIIRKYHKYVKFIPNSQLISSEMTGIGLDLRFVQPSPLKFRIGPVHNSGPNPLGAAKLESGQRLHVDWTVLPVPEFRLTESVQQQAIK